MRAGKRRAGEREWRNEVMRPKARRFHVKRRSPGVLRYVFPVIRAVSRALWQYLSGR